MKLAIMQPYFFPYIGYFSLIKHTDKFILFDTPQFIRHGWIERNRILKPQNGWQYISVPLQKKSLSTQICDTKINDDSDWKAKIISQLAHYKKKAPFYFKTINVIKDALDTDTLSITHLNMRVLEKCCEYLNINFQYEIFSEMDLNIVDVNAPDEWALNISCALGAKEYWNPIGGLEFFDRNKYIRADIDLFFQKMNIVSYPQFNGEVLENGLSIIDVMMFNPPEKINEMLDNYELI